MSVSSDQQLAGFQRLAYAAPAFALALLGIPVYVYLPRFYTDVVGVDVAMVGALLLSVRLFDAVTDPLIGRISDRVETRFGRRRPWIALGALPLALFTWLLFAPPELAPREASVWLGVCLFGAFLFATIVNVPYESLAPELTNSYDERTTLLSLRDGVLLVGTVVAAVSPALVAWTFGLPSTAAGERAKFARMVALYGPLLIALCAFCALSVRERSASERAGAGHFELRSMLRNRPFVILLISYTVSALGSNLPATLITYYVAYVLMAEGVELFLLLYFVTGVVFLPLWVWLSRRRGKKLAWIAAMAVNTGAFIGVFFLGPGDLIAYGVLVVLSGVGFGATAALPSAMQADVIDYDELRSGRRREGQYVGVWAIARKLTAAFGVGIALPILGWVGYQPNVEQTPEVKLALRTLYALVPSACNLIGIAVALSYPISRERHERILEGIERRRRGGDALDPLSPEGAIS